MPYNEYVDTGWKSLDEARSLAYRKIGRVVYVRGVIRTVDDGKQIATMPLGFRPPTTHYICPYSSTTNYAIAAFASSGAITVAVNININFFTSFTAG